MSMRMVLASLGVLLALTGCSTFQEAMQDSVRQGTIEGLLSVLGQDAIQEAAGVELKDVLDCVAEPSSGGDHRVDCSGQTEDGRKASVKGDVTSVDAAKGVVRGRLAFAFDGKELGEMDCLGVC
ncbi:hypothetical protein DP939_26085 [Spongiactinospora rosea]|uniref:Lipoprotein n=1 Tax=Spongiactinospora rosea TaxID=2248750 RepID=A0A366LTW1_9ACTN|nr:hypothetical protein [Spongiactinospora rosea]RBQ17395.1 hypothetical protein DP939_26085 [Spongiactinospora rosea]